MSAQTIQPEAILERLERVEKENRRIKQAGLAFLILGVSALVMGQARPTRSVVANEFVLEDASGNRRGVLLASEKGARLDLFGEGDTGAQLSTEGAISKFSLFNSARGSVQIMSLGVAKSGDKKPLSMTSVSLFDADASTASVILASVRGSGLLTMTDDKGESESELTAHEVTFKRGKDMNANFGVPSGTPVYPETTEKSTPFPMLFLRDGLAS